MCRRQTQIERMSDEDFARIVAEPDYITKGDLWFPEKLEAKKVKRHLMRVQQQASLKKNEIEQVREVSSGKIKTVT
ncbi:hypothetical protein BTO01_10600 [Vibrio jasicida]|uniref:hypothetical protein n=1 Tax=Vibrio jasicida TaxID=766224 RepID=UPI000CF3A8E5|nr:hypothetical protein [Vibrio jasicida]PQJ65768.1 hypothetical protein BTO01_10600 [Vibrio jasicida]